MAVVYKVAASPYWYFDITVLGTRTRRSTKRTKKSEALVVARAETKRALDKSQLGDDRPTLTLRQALLDHYLPAKLGRASYKNLERSCRTLCGDREGVAGLGGETQFHQVTSAMLQAYRARRLAQGLSPQSVDHEIKCVSAAYNMVKEDYFVRAGIRFPLARPKGKPRYLLPAEEKALLASLDPGRPLRARGGGTYSLPPTSLAARQRADNYDLVVTLLDTGCRFGEIANLVWTMVDTDDGRWVHVYRTKVGSEGRLALTDRLKAVLRRRCEAQEGSQYVFSGFRRSGGDTPRSTTHAIRRAMAEVGINDPIKVARFGRRDVRSLRDTFATKLRQRGMALDRLQKLLGHASGQMTEKYAELAVHVVSAEAAAMLNEIDADFRAAR